MYQTTSLVHWVMPIFGREYDLIKNSGIESFDAAVTDAEVSWVEVRRDACIQLLDLVENYLSE
ncbi:MAG: hypothetical protein V7765_17600 [Oleispira sp.]